MARNFNNRNIELLAPAGTMETFKNIVNANCDAIYLGGKSLNMRMIRKGYNFSNKEIEEAIKLAHNANKRVYITLNNMLSDDQIELAVEYLYFLQKSKVDGIIIQDLGIVQLCKDNNINNLNIHSSVMMNIHNLQSAKALKKQGVSRIILSRQMDLQSAKLIQMETEIETEYFVHGDICSVNDANCYFSSIVFGNSSNCGRCFKPCRWAFKVKKDGFLYNTKYPLAAKDMYMYEHIPELLNAHITSFKIEGRMRNTDFITKLVNTYGEAIDRYIGNPLSYDRKKYSQDLYSSRKRDFTTGYSFENPRLDFINDRHEGTGKFYSTGKVFSVPTEEIEITEDIIDNTRSLLIKPCSKPHDSTKLTVKVNNFEHARLCIKLDASRVYIPCEVFAPDQFISTDELYTLANIKNNTELYLDLPQHISDLQFDMLDRYLNLYGHLFDGLLVSCIGAVDRYGEEYKLIGNYCMNINNTKSMEFYKDLGVKSFTISIEAKKENLLGLLTYDDNELELIVHGPIKLMYLNYNLYENTKALSPSAKENNKYVDNNFLVLKSDKGENPVYIDQFNKNHIYSSKELCLMPILDCLKSNSITSYRIEGQGYNIDELRSLITTYQIALSNTNKCREIFCSMNPVRAGFTFGSLSY